MISIAVCNLPSRKGQNVRILKQTSEADTKTFRTIPCCNPQLLQVSYDLRKQMTQLIKEEEEEGKRTRQILDFEDF